MIACWQRIKDEHLENPKSKLPKFEKMSTAKGRRPETVIDDLAEVLPTSVRKSYFMLSDAERDVLNIALEKYRPEQVEPILVGGPKAIKPALRLMTWYRLAIEEIKDGQATMSYTRWVDAVEVKGSENQEVYVTLSPRFEGIWLESNAWASYLFLWTNYIQP
jgi:hypothetical protein